jgi:hypothetical protein
MDTPFTPTTGIATGIDWRESRELPRDPMAAYAASAHAERIEELDWREGHRVQKYYEARCGEAGDD